RALVTSPERLRALGPVPAQCESLRWLVHTEGAATDATPSGPERIAWRALLDAGGDNTAGHAVVDTDLAAILYTSGSTGPPKGVMLSHRNLVTGAASVVSYLENRPDDRLLCVLPFSFDYGLSQLTTAFNAGACAVLLNYLMPRDVIAAVAREGITGLACVPPLWIQLAELDWPEAARQSLRYITNSGGAMPRPILAALRNRLPETSVFLMYGLTEAFRSTYLPPSEIDRRPDSIGKAIPNAEVLVVREDGEPCAPGEPGELVHGGPLAALGYWNDPARTAERFRPMPGANAEIAVWSGDTVRADADGFLYFVGRRDDMIKTSGYRISPTEVEDVIYASGLVGEAVVIGVPHPVLGQGVVAVATAPAGGDLDEDALLAFCRRELPAFMTPRAIVERAALPRNANGKIERRRLAGELADLLLRKAEAAP
ncbi:MAG: acyl-CoA ligase (AMP-forming), exosortase A system-associated, partial [Alphaproteobacteria bacterium]